MYFVVAYCVNDSYNQSGVYFLCSAANKCLLKVAQYAAQVEHYEKAINIYEQVNQLIMTDSFMKVEECKTLLMNCV